MTAAGKVCLLLTLAVAARVAPAQPANAPATSVSGVVVNAVSNQPVPYALVQIEGSQPRATLADLNGRFQFDRVPLGQASLSARKPGYFNEQELARGPRRPRNVNIGADMPPITLSLTPEAVISGHVVSEDGQPIESGVVTVIGSVIVNGRKTLQRAGAATGHADGEYRVANLRPGNYFVVAGARGDLDSRLAGDRSEGYPLELFYPGVADLGSATALRLAAGRQATADFTFKRVPLFHVAGMLSGFPPGQAFSVMLRPTSAFGQARGAQSDSSGHFELRLIPAGRYLLTASVDGLESERLGAELPIEVTSNVDNLRVPLVAPLTIPVTMRNEFTIQQEAGPGTPGGAQPDPPQDPFAYASLRMVPLDSNDVQRGGSGFATGGESPRDGERNIVVRGLHPGAYRAVITEHGPYYVESANCGAVDLLREPLTVTSTSPTDPIEIVLRNDGGMVQGSVRLNADDAGATVLLYSSNATLVVPHVANLNVSSASFRFGGIAPGDYTLVALDRVDDLEYANRDAMASYLARGTQVTVTSGATISVTLDLIRRGQ